MTTEEQTKKYLDILTRFVKSNNIINIKCTSLHLEDEVFYELNINYAEQMEIGESVYKLEAPTYFVQFRRDHVEYQFEIR